jgi:orotidine-5'-phosphate decarboxylase
LRARLDKHGPLCVGIDPSPELLHAWGLDDSPAGLDRFSRTVVDAVSDLVGVVKPQSAFYERWGSRGIAVLEQTIADLRDAGTLVLLDVKRGDIGSTMTAYAEAYLDRGSPLAADAVTLSPYLGFGSLRGAITSALASDAGVFVLARTSNPEATALQSAVAGEVYEGVRAANEGASPLGSIGVVVGATVASPGYPLDLLNGPVLAPGLGTQGASPTDLGRLFASVRHAVVPSVSRAVLADPAKLRMRTERYRDECVHHLSS